MKEFIALRTKARENRDRVINLARQEYERTLVEIAKLEQDLLGKESSRHKKISACIESVIPQDREFTTVDIMTALEALDPARVWRKRSVDSHIFRLREKGLLRRVRRSHKADAAIYARVGATVEVRPFENMTLVEVVAAMLEGRSMTQTELVVAMVEAGYETQMSKGALRNAVGVAMRKDDRFTKSGDKWTSSR